MNLLKQEFIMIKIMKVSILIRYLELYSIEIYETSATRITLASSFLQGYIVWKIYKKLSAILKSCNYVYKSTKIIKCSTHNHYNTTPRSISHSVLSTSLLKFLLLINYCTSVHLYLNRYVA